MSLNLKYKTGLSVSECKESIEKNFTHYSVKTEGDFEPVKYRPYRDTFRLYKLELGKLNKLRQEIDVSLKKQNDYTNVCISRKSATKEPRTLKQSTFKIITMVLLLCLLGFSVYMGSENGVFKVYDASIVTSLVLAVPVLFVFLSKLILLFRVKVLKCVPFCEDEIIYRLEVDLKLRTLDCLESTM